MKTIQVFYCERNYSGEFFPEKFAEFVAWAQGLLDGIPEEHRSTATIRMSADSEYDSPYPTLEIEYRRPETPEELIEQEQREQQRNRRTPRTRGAAGAANACAQWLLGTLLRRGR